MDKTAEQAQEMAQALHLGITMGYEDRLEECIDEVMLMAYDDLDNDDEEPNLDKMVSINDIITRLRTLE